VDRLLNLLHLEQLAIEYDLINYENNIRKMRVERTFLRDQFDPFEISERSVYHNLSYLQIRQINQAMADHRIESCLG
jgi:hypothetical protein